LIVVPGFMSEVEERRAFDIARFVEHHQRFVTVVLYFEILGMEIAGALLAVAVFKNHLHFPLIIDKPRDIKGTALLNFTHKTGNDDQWLYLPALKRVKRISSANRSGSFMGSEFAYEDVTSQEVEKYTYKWIRDETYEGMECFVFERYPAYKNSGYTRQVVWLDKKEYRLLKIDFYDRKNSLLKTQTFRGHHQYLEKYWHPDEMFMQNHQTGKSTLLKWSDYKFKNGFKDRDFNRNSLKRAR